jgi:hypothetical protein
MQGGAYQPTSGADNTPYFIGVAQSTVTHGQSVDVKFFSSTDTQQSGLTPAGKVYTSIAGVLSNTLSVTQVGISTSATDVLITKLGSNL